MARPRGDIEEGQNRIIKNFCSTRLVRFNENLRRKYKVRTFLLYITSCVSLYHFKQSLSGTTVPDAALYSVIQYNWLFSGQESNSREVAMYL